MRLSELLSETEVALDSVTTRKWTPAQKVAAINTQNRSLTRKLAELDEDYSNFTFTLPLASGRKPKQDVVSYRLPAWVYKISAVRRSQGGATAVRGPILGRATKFNAKGWKLTASNELSLLGFSSAIDLEIDAAKDPARMTLGTLPSQAAMTTSQMRMDADPGTYPHETIQNSYAGGIFEITGVASARVGQTLRCTASLHDQSSIGTILTFEEAWTSVPLAADTYEMRLEMPGAHSRLLVLLATRALLAQERNMEGISVFAPELNEQWRLFLESIENRDMQQPQTVIDVIPVEGEYATNPYTYLEEYR